DAGTADGRIATTAGGDLDTSTKTEQPSAARQPGTADRPVTSDADRATRETPRAPAPTKTELAPKPQPKPMAPERRRDGGSIEMGGSIQVPARDDGERPAATPPRSSQPPLLSRPARLGSDPGADARGTPAEPRRRTGGTAGRRLEAGLAMLDRNELVEGRAALSPLLEDGVLDPADAKRVRDRLTAVNERLVFGPEIVPGDPFAIEYAIESGDRLYKVPRKNGAATDYRFVARINGITDAGRIRLGDRVKLIRGPFHAIIHKSAYRLDLFMGEPGNRVYVRSFDVGLGEFNRTPTGRFTVRPNSKLEDPEWINPRTRERFSASDPKNPIGEYWLGLMGDEEHNKALAGYGIHGTIEPETIGRQASMGCIRMRPEDVAIVWEVLLERTSTVTILD
ncbi:MAG: L,D-transpeptidase, partial [Planctomycetota bacterium]